MGASESRTAAADNFWSPLHTLEPFVPSDARVASERRFADIRDAIGGVVPDVLLALICEYHGRSPITHMLFVDGGSDGFVRRWDTGDAAPCEAVPVAQHDFKHVSAPLKLLALYDPSPIAPLAVVSASNWVWALSDQLRIGRLYRHRHTDTYDWVFAGQLPAALHPFMPWQRDGDGVVDVCRRFLSQTAIVDDTFYCFVAGTTRTRWLASIGCVSPMRA